MIHIKTSNEKKRSEYISCLENEISRCKKMDIPFKHIENILIVLKEVNFQTFKNKSL